MKEIKSPVGIWMDYRGAQIIKIDQLDISLCMYVESDIDEEHPVGGSGSSTPYGPQEAISEHRFLNKRHQQEQKFYQTIMSKIKDRDALYIMGPGQAKLGLENAVKADKNFNPVLLEVETSHKLTPNQIKAKVKDYFHLLGCSEPARKLD